MYNPAARSVDELPGDEVALLLESRRNDDFMAALAHELRNPLTPICAGIELLKQGGDDPVVVLLVRSMMERQVKHMTRMIDDLTDISRIARGRLELQFEHLSLESILQSAAE